MTHSVPTRRSSDLQIAAGRGVVHRLRHCADHVARQVGLDARYERCGDHRASHHLVRRRRHWQIAGITGFRSSGFRSEEHTPELQSPMRISYAVSCLTKKSDEIATMIRGYSA